MSWCMKNVEKEEELCCGRVVGSSHVTTEKIPTEPSLAAGARHGLSRCAARSLEQRLAPVQVAKHGRWFGRQQSVPWCGHGARKPRFILSREMYDTCSRCLVQPQGGFGRPSQRAYLRDLFNTPPITLRYTTLKRLHRTVTNGGPEVTQYIGARG